MEMPVGGDEKNTITPASGGLPAGPPGGSRQRWRIALPRLSPAERRLLLWIVDVLVLNISLLLALVLRFGYTFSWRTLTAAWGYFVLLTALWAVWAAFFDCHDLPATADASESAWRTGRAGVLTALCYLAIPLVTPYFGLSRLSTYLFLVLVTVSVPAWRVLYAAVFVQPVFQQRVLIVGAGHAGADLARVLAATPRQGNPYAGSGYQAVGFVDDDPAKLGTQVEGLPVLGNRHDLLRLVDEYQVDTVVLSITDAGEIHTELVQSLLDYREQGLHMVPMVVLYERLTGRVPVEHVRANLEELLPLQDSATRRVFDAGKRLADLIVAGLGLVLLALIAPGVALANALWSPGPLFYWQTRVGRGGRPFRIVKFRSMIPSAEADGGAVWASASDPRVTPAGRILRRTRLDELPQVWNILKGEMSLIGPRPERPEFVAGLVAQVPFYQARHAVRPGITGWAQVRYRYGSSVEDARVKLEYDLYYIKHQGLYLGLSILAKTAAVVLGLQGR
jgi:exopolysaccharide biosynthesis polyprenyl glycosylphosphotransferase